MIVPLLHSEKGNADHGKHHECYQADYEAAFTNLKSSAKLAHNRIVRFLLAPKEALQLSLKEPTVPWVQSIAIGVYACRGKAWPTKRFPQTGIGCLNVPTKTRVIPVEAPTKNRC